MMVLAWAEDPSRCAVEDCMAEGTERWERDHWHGPLFYCKQHFAQRADRDAALLTGRNRNRRDR